MEKTIYRLELHEQLEVSDGFFVTRVPGGWLYELNRGDDNYTNTFVPFDNEFEV